MQEEQHDILSQTDGNKVQNSTIEVQSAENKAIEEIENLNAEVREDTTGHDIHEEPMQNYEALSMENLVEELEKLTSTDKIMSVKNHIE